MSAVLFDLDGTVTDPGIGITNSVAYALRKFGIEPPERKELYRFIGPPLRESFSKYFGLSASDAEKAVGYYREYYRPTGIFECSLYDGITETFSALVDAGFTVALATAKPEVFAEKIAVHFGFDRYLTCISGAALDGSRDDKAKIISIALQKSVRYRRRQKERLIHRRRPVRLRHKGGIVARRRVGRHRVRHIGNTDQMFSPSVEVGVIDCPFSAYKSS